ncbi:MAG: HAD family hydrolase [Candidatus Glassbacteria bacterium]|nr:HAD family hydrolase [Candidatus Glassbacteria bacterium]
MRNITCEAIEPYLRYYGLRSGFEVEVSFGQYDNIFQEAVGQEAVSGLLDEQTDCVLVCCNIMVLSPLIYRQYVGVDARDLKAELERLENYFHNVATGIRNKTKAMILWLSPREFFNPALGILDYQYANGQLGLVQEVERLLQEQLRSFGNAYLVKQDHLLQKIGAERFYDLRHWYLFHCPYSKEAFQLLAEECFIFVRAAGGKARKCLVLDCDNVLWGGIVGEDGLDGIRLSDTYPGLVYKDFQQQVINLFKRGVIIALCSKNNEEDVWEIFEKHPDMLLERGHIAAWRINWQDKATNLRELSEELNIGIDSMVFLDDSPYEIELVRTEVPEVETIQLPAGKITANAGVLSECRLFDTLVFSAEDSSRGQMYVAEARRKKLKGQITDLDSYLKTLEMELTISLVDEISIPRVAQLTQRTNQFNLTTRRYSDQQISSLAGSDDSDVLYSHLRDKFGESGIIGVCILKYKGECAMIDVFLLSCRALGRRVEDELLGNALELARSKGCRQATAEYLPTRKNIQVKEFFPLKGFTVVDCNPDGVTRYRLELEPDGVKKRAACFKQVSVKFN